MSHSRRIIVTGATGLIGRSLCQQLIFRGDQVVVFSRNPSEARARVAGASEYVAWSPNAVGEWEQELARADAVVHLAGASIAGQRWSESYKREILESRVQGTRGIVDAIERSTTRPDVLVNASGVDYYGDKGEATVDESAAPGTGFLSQVCIAWEREALRAEQFGVRTVVLRTGIVLDKSEGALAKLLLPFQLGVGGPVLPGSQWWSWIHRDDLVGLILLALDQEQARGPLNGTAPEPLRNRDFSAILGQVLNRPSWAPVPAFALKVLIGEMAVPLLIEKQRAIPRKALELGYQFRYAQLAPALRAALDG